jgi:hypothetical protein
MAVSEIQQAFLCAGGNSGSLVILGLYVGKFHKSVAQVFAFSRWTDGKCALGGGEMGEASCEE